ncbi:hypothetical protein Q4561_08295 [Alteromonas sp. 1_MG-2023]|uniref:alpha/beta hydrolase family protein n=1 Tax=Alteromonas sp. 1_MG-2023 TaxID=3062669 RepID=UPI0026E27E9E|nr:hypothetical protein [Alteromonas sp. 1_MG-2023]MDO6567057.1 hypothetical protein [Alteromonas sp. 1_MG-2023]
MKMKILYLAPLPHSLAFSFLMLINAVTVFASTGADDSAGVGANASFELKTQDVDFFDQKANRPAKVKFWYQADTRACDAKICLRSAQNKHKVAVISHGAFGSPNSMNWLGYALASQGWIVAGVAHYGESWVYGQDTIDPSVLQRFWQRPQEISFVIDSLTKSGLFNHSLETDDIVMFGHSSGGFTALAMAGAKLAAGKSEAYCMSEKAKDDKGCDYSAKKASSVESSSVNSSSVKNSTKPLSKEMLEKIGILQAQMKDERITSVIAFDPALGHAANEASLKAIKVPTLILGSVDNDFLPYETHAKYYADNIPNAKLVGVEQGAGHFIYIDDCNNDREVKGVPLCKDRDGVDRKALQKQLLNHVFQFISSGKN